MGAPGSLKNLAIIDLFRSLKEAELGTEPTSCATFQCLPHKVPFPGYCPVLSLSGCCRHLAEGYILNLPLRKTICAATDSSGLGNAPDSCIQRSQKHSRLSGSGSFFFFLKGHVNNLLWCRMPQPAWLGIGTELPVLSFAAPFGRQQLRRPKCGMLDMDVAFCPSLY